MSFVVTTYNVLAPGYIQPQWYPLTPPELLRSEHRVPALAEYLARLDADIMCLQEVEPETFAPIERRLSAAGFEGRFTQKREGRRDGCATFARRSSATWMRESSLGYDDSDPGQRPSGHIAQVAVLEVEGKLLAVANTHIRWDPPGTPRERQISLRQVTQLIGSRSQLAPECAGWIICGDLNADPESTVVEALRAAGFAFSHAENPAPTCNANREARVVDYLFFDQALAATPRPVVAVTNDTPLPSAEQPSDHVPVTATFTWRLGPAD